MGDQPMRQAAIASSPPRVGKAALKDFARPQYEHYRTFEGASPSPSDTTSAFIFSPITAGIAHAQLLIKDQPMGIQA